MPTVSHFARGGIPTFTVPMGKSVNAVRVNASPATYSQPAPELVSVTPTPNANDVVEIDYGYVTRTVTAGNQFTGAYRASLGERVLLSIGGTGWTATVVLQISTDSGSTWTPVATYTEPGARLFECPASCLIRLGVATGAFGSGSIPVRIDS